MDKHKNGSTSFWQRLAEDNRLHIVLIVFVPLLCMVGYFLVLIYWADLATDWTTRGTFGDSFGALTAFFTGAGFIGFLVALYLQRQDLNTQRKSIEIQQEELKQSNEELRMTRDVFQQQTFETTFFNILELSAKTIEDRGLSEEHLLRKLAFELYNGSLINYDDFFSYIIRNPIDISPSGMRKACVRVYDDAMGEHGDLFLSLTVLLEALAYDTIAFVPESRKYIYSKIIRSKLPCSVFYYLTFYCLGEGRTVRQLKVLMERFHFFEQIDQDIRRVLFLDHFYLPSAFGE